MSVNALDDRSREVLKSLIQDHITTGEPVGSESLARRLSRPLSSASVRNIMADLERKGYLSHPHTSAGRVPTDDGYRFYVDGLMGRTSLSPADTEAIRSRLRTRDASPDQVMETASHLLSRLSRHVGFVLAPDIGRTTFRRVDLVKCVTVDLEVPASSHIVLEGYVEPGERRREGPFGDHTGFYSHPDDYPVFHILSLIHI